MEYWMFAAAGLSAVLLVAHVVGGRKDVHIPMLESGLSPLLKAYTSIIWHAVTAVLAIDTAALFLAARGQGDGLAILVMLQYLAFVGLFLGYGLSRINSILVMPQWVAFLAISILAGVGLWA